MKETALAGIQFSIFCTRLASYIEQCLALCAVFQILKIFVYVVYYDDCIAAKIRLGEKGGRGGGTHSGSRRCSMWSGQSSSYLELALSLSSWPFFVFFFALSRHPVFRPRSFSSSSFFFFFLSHSARRAPAYTSFFRERETFLPCSCFCSPIYIYTFVLYFSRYMYKTARARIFFLLEMSSRYRLLVYIYVYKAKRLDGL